MQSQPIGPRGIYTAIPGMDPRADWLFGPGKQDYLPNGDDKLIPFIITVYDDEGINSLRELVASESPLFIAPEYADSLEPGRYFPALAPKGFFDALADPEGDFNVLRNAAKAIKLGAPLKEAALPSWKPGETAAPLEDPPIGPPDTVWPDGTVVIGIIDDGIAFAHERFRTTNHGSRVQCFWRQDHPDTSATVEFGHEICKPGANGIDDLLSNSPAANALDEDQFYRRAGLIDFAVPGHKAAAWRIAHGTHVLDLAAGEDPGKDVLNRPIIGVQLPIATTEDTSGGSDLTPMVLRAVDYILKRADALAGDAGPLPVVINFSYGLIAGPHDGTSELERALDARIQARPDQLRIVLPAGNSHLSRCHAEVRFARKGEIVELAWRVQPDDQTPSWLELWLPHEGAAPPAASRIEISVVAPGGAAQTVPLPELHNSGTHILDDAGNRVCDVGYVFHFAPTERGRYLVELQPTARLQPSSAPVAPSGVWTIRLHNLKLQPDQPVQAWIQRDERIYGYPRRARQSYFDEGCYVRFDAQGREVEEDGAPAQAACHVKRAGLVNALATSDGTVVATSAGAIVATPVVAGGYLRKEYRLARYSAGEPITPPPGGAANPAFRKPDATLVSDDSKVHSGVLAAGSRSGSVVAISGTSVAAPQLTRWLADRLAIGNPADRNAVKAAAQAQDTPPPALPPQRGGWGRMLKASAFPRDRYWD